MAMYTLFISTYIKSTEILFNIRNSLSSIRLNITISNIPIECISNIHFLDLFIDNKLNWKIHISTYKEKYQLRY